MTQTLSSALPGTRRLNPWVVVWLCFAVLSIVTLVAAWAASRMPVVPETGDPEQRLEPQAAGFPS